MVQPKTRVVYTPHEGTAPQGELDALCAAYRFILDCHAEKKGGPDNRPEDARKDRHARTYSYST